MTADANREGLRIVRSDPALLAIELLWRWSFGLGLLALAFLAYARLRQAVFLSGADELAFRSHDPFAVAAAARDLLAAALPSLREMLTPALCVAAVLWIVAATLGRGIITRVIVRRLAADYAVPIAPDAPRWSGFALLNFARVLTLLILVIGYLGGLRVAAYEAGPEPDLLASSLIIFASLAVSALLWNYVNWVLSLAPIFVVRDALPPLDSVVAAIAFIGRNRSRLMAISIRNGTLRGVVATAASVAGVLTAALGLPPWVISALIALETLAYLVVSDFYLLARLGANASVAVRELVLSQPLPVQPQRSGSAAR